MHRHFSVWFLLLMGLLLGTLWSTSRVLAQPALPDRGVMSDAYWELWNDDVQKEIDARIEKYRKADAQVTLENVKVGSEIRVE